MPHMFTAIDHVGIAVADLDQAIEFYRQTFGMQVVHEIGRASCRERV